MLKKTLSLFTLAIFLFSVTFNDLALAQSQSQEFKKPTFEEIYKNYSFLDTANLSEIVSYSEQELKKELEELKKREFAEKVKIKTEQKNALTELKKGQKALKENASKVEKLRKKYTTTSIVIENNKPRKDKRVDENALANDSDYQTLTKERESLECQVREWQIKSNEMIFEAKLKKIELVYEVLETQLDLLKKWPVALQKVEADIQSGKADERKFADPENIGLRDLGVGDQADDLKIWEKNQEAKQFLEELKKLEYKDTEVKNYVVGLIKLIANNSDLKIPVDEKRIFIINEDDVNAFAAPGGVWGINRGLLLFTENEAELAGVLAHEISHVTARHYDRLRKKDQIAGIIYQAVQLGAMFLTGGTMGLLAYYLLQYGFMGLGMFLSLKLLGVTRDFEVEADILGMQYLEKTGYSPTSIITLFERMGRDKGYVRQTSYFRTHPAFAERVTNVLKELLFLILKDQYIENSSDFLEMQARLCVAQELEKADAAKRAEKQKRPSLTRGQQKKEEELDEKCGLQRAPLEQKNSPCDKPELKDLKEKVRAEVAAEKEKEEKGENSRPKLKRP